MDRADTGRNGRRDVVEMTATKKKPTKATATKRQKESKPVTLTPRQKLDALGEDEILGMVANCVYYRHIAEKAGVSVTALMNWLNAREELYARAREARADKLAEDIIEIADASENDTYTDENGVERTNQEVVARARLRVDARKWLAAKMLPKKYGDKLQVGGAEDLPPVKQDVTLTPDEAYLRMLGHTK